MICNGGTGVDGLSDAHGSRRSESCSSVTYRMSVCSLVVWIGWIVDEGMNVAKCK